MSESVFFFVQETSDVVPACLVGSEMCIMDSNPLLPRHQARPAGLGSTLMVRVSSSEGGVPYTAVGTPPSLDTTLSFPSTKSVPRGWGRLSWFETPLVRVAYLTQT